MIQPVEIRLDGLDTWTIECFDAQMDAAPRPRKRLVICCDGTWNKPDSPNVTNVEKIARTVETDLRRTDGVQQLVLYLTGVGTSSYSTDRILGGAFGLGLFANVRSAYRFLALNYDPGDEIFVFGFSRGAYTARSLVGMVGRVGLLTREALVADRLGEAVARYQAGPGKRTEHPGTVREFREKYCHPTSPVTLLGVFDTVGALGVPGAVSTKHLFHDVNLSPIVRCARQALALDERRLNFEPSLWEAPEEQAISDEASGRVEQVWFPGVHSDVGGGYRLCGLSDTTLLWMASEAGQRGLVFDPRLLEVYVGCGQPAIRNTSLTPAYRVLNVLSASRMKLRGSGGGFVRGWRRLAPTGPKGERPIGIKVASTAVAMFREGHYRHPNLTEFARARQDFANCERVVESLPRDTSAVRTGPGTPDLPPQRRRLATSWSRPPAGFRR